MIPCSAGCGTTLFSTEHPIYELRIKETYAVSELLRFCSAGCLCDYVTLSSQGLRTPKFYSLKGGMSDEFENRVREGLNTE